MDRTLDRLAPLTGALFTVLTLVALLGLEGDTPDSDASATDVVSFYTDHRDQQTAGALVLALGAVALIFFAGSLRQAFRGPEPGAERRASIVFGGALVAAVGLACMAGSHFALAENTHHISAQAAQALNATDGGTWIVAQTGMVTLLAAAGLVAVTTRRVLPVWMGWVAIALGVLGVTPIGWLGAALGILWIGAVGVVLWHRAGTEAESGAPLSPTPARSPA